MSENKKIKVKYRTKPSVNVFLKASVIPILPSSLKDRFIITHSGSLLNFGFFLSSKLATLDVIRLF